MVNCQPYLPLSVVDTAQVAPRHRKAGLSLYGLHVAGLGYKNRKSSLATNTHSTLPTPRTGYMYTKVFGLLWHLQADQEL